MLTTPQTDIRHRDGASLWPGRQASCSLKLAPTPPCGAFCNSPAHCCCAAMDCCPASASASASPHETAACSQASSATAHSVAESCCSSTASSASCGGGSGKCRAHRPGGPRQCCLHRQATQAAPPAATPWRAPSGLQRATIVSAGAVAVGSSTGVSQLPLELLGSIVQLVLQDDAAQQRRPVVQFVGRQWLAAYRCAAYSAVRLDLGAALLRVQQRHGLGEAAAATALLHGLAARLPYAAEVSLSGVPLPTGRFAGAGGSTGGAFACQLRWQLGELLVGGLAVSSRLRRLSLDFLPHHVPLLLALRGQYRWEGRQVAPLDSLALAEVPSSQLLANAQLLSQQPLQELGICDAACLGEAGAAELAAVLPAFPLLTRLSLGGAPLQPACRLQPRNVADTPAFRHVPAVGALGSPGCPWAGTPGGSPAAAQQPLPLQPSGGTCLPELSLVAAAASLPGLQQLELSLTFGRAGASGQGQQPNYLEQLGFVLHQQRQHRERAAALAALQQEEAACGSSGDDGATCSRVSVIVHENVQGDLSAVPVASCSLNLDWDSESNPIEVWQCSTLNELRISAQLPLQAGHFRPARLAALQVLQVVGCCHIPAYFAAALCSMQQLVRLEMTDCQLEAVAAIPWQLVLPHLPDLRELAVERCAGAALLPDLWAGLAGAARLSRLRITGQSRGGGLPGRRGLGAGRMGAAAPPRPSQQQGQQQHGLWATAAQQQQQQAGAAATIPDCVALMQHLRCLDLSNNGLQALPDALAWCQQLTSVQLAGNRLRTVPTGVAALGGLCKLDLSSNQLEALGTGPYLQRLEELCVGANLTLTPAGLPDALVQLRRLRRLGLPLWWQLAGGSVGQAQALLQGCMPWLLLESS